MTAKQMVDSARELPLSWLSGHRDMFDAVGVYIGGPRSAGHHSVAWCQELLSAGFNVLGIYVGSQAHDVNSSGNPGSKAFLEQVQCADLIQRYGLEDHPVCWDFEPTQMTDKIRQHLDALGDGWSKDNHPFRFLYSSDYLLSEYDWKRAGWSEIWRANYKHHGYTPGLTPEPGIAWQYSGGTLLDGQTVDFSCYDPRLFQKAEAVGDKMHADAVSILPSVSGYYVVSASGEVFSYGDAIFYGSLGGKSITAPIVDASMTHTGKGYWLVGADGAVYAFGDAGFFGHPVRP